MNHNHQPDLSLDLRGEHCPYNAIATLEALADIAPQRPGVADPPARAQTAQQLRTRPRHRLGPGHDDIIGIGARIDRIGRPAQTRGDLEPAAVEADAVLDIQIGPPRGGIGKVEPAARRRHIRPGGLVPDPRDALVIGFGCVAVETEGQLVFRPPGGEPAHRLNIQLDKGLVVIEPIIGENAVAARRGVAPLAEGAIAAGRIGQRRAQRVQQPVFRRPFMFERIALPVQILLALVMADNIGGTAGDRYPNCG